MKRIIRQAGFTLLEILIATGIFMTVMVVAVGIFSSTISSSSTTSQLRVTAQSARYVFESVARELRSAHGLAKVLPNTGGQQQFIILPFDYDKTRNQLVINQVQKTGVDTTSSLPLYKNTRKTYTWNLATNPKTITLKVEEMSGSFTVAQIDGGQAGYVPKSTTNLLPTDIDLVDFQISRIIQYASIPEAQSTKPFVSLQMTVAGKAGTGSQVKTKAQTTLQTTIVPRDFISPYDVVQEGLGGS